MLAILTFNVIKDMMLGSICYSFSERVAPAIDSSWLFMGTGWFLIDWMKYFARYDNDPNIFQSNRSFDPQKREFITVAKVHNKTKEINMPPSKNYVYISDIFLACDCSMGFGSQKPDGLSVAAMPNSKAGSLPTSTVRGTNTHLWLTI